MSLLRTLLFSTICLFVAPLHAQSLDSLTGTPPATEGEAKPAQLSLGEQTQRMVQQTETSNKRAEDLKALLAQAPKEIAEAQRELAKLKASPDEDPAQRYAKQSVEALEQRLSARVEELSEWQKQFSAANSMIITAQTRPERAQAQISTAQTRIQEINNLLKSGRESGKPLSEERRGLLDAEIVSLSAQIDLRRQELAGNSLLQDLGKARRDLLAERIARAEQDTQALQSLINEKRRAESEQTVAEFSARVQQAGSDKLLAAESAENLKLSD